MDAAHTTQVAHSPWSPFRHATFTVIWIATLISNVGAWMYSAASAWLMTSLDADPLMVSLVQVAATLPMVLFALPAGALADIVDKRRYLIGAESFIAVASTLFAALVWLRLINPSTLLLFIFLIESGSAATAAAWQSVVPQLVPRQELPAAVAMNSAGINVSRALGPALGGLITARLRNRSAILGQRREQLGSDRSATALAFRAHVGTPNCRRSASISALRTGVRHSRQQSTSAGDPVARCRSSFCSPSCYWALLPLVALNQVGGGAAFYGVLLGTVGASAIAARLPCRGSKRRLGLTVS